MNSTIFINIFEYFLENIYFLILEFWAFNPVNHLKFYFYSHFLWISYASISGRRLKVLLLYLIFVLLNGIKYSVAPEWNTFDKRPFFLEVVVILLNFVTLIRKSNIMLHMIFCITLRITRKEYDLNCFDGYEFVRRRKEEGENILGIITIRWLN